MILCTNCQTRNRDQARFCLLCGARLQPPADEAPSLDAGEIASPVEVEIPTIESPVQLEKEDTPEPADEVIEPAIEAETEAELELELEPEPAALEESDPQADQPAPPVETDVVPEEQPEQPFPADEFDPLPGFEVASPPPPEPEPEMQEMEETADADEAAAEPAEEQVDEEAAPADRPLLPSLEIGTTLLDRYEIRALLEETPETLLYEASDHGRCALCNFADSIPGDSYCANCGASLEDQDPPPCVHLRSLRIAGETIIELEEETDGRIERWFEADGRLYAVIPIKEPEHQAPEDGSAAQFVRGVRHIVGYNSDTGLEREVDEDAMLALTLMPMFESLSKPSLGLYAVADGMGGHDRGEIASRMVVEGLADTIVKRLFLPELNGETVLPETPAAMLTQAIQDVNTRINALQQATGSDLGTTVTAVLLRGNVAVIANVGDSRTYLWRQGELQQITVDHSLVARLVAAGAIEPEEIYTHPEKSAIYRSLGHSDEIEVDIFDIDLLPSDRLVLCCDGIWEMLRDDGIEEVLLLEADPQRAGDEMVRRSNLAGGEDNLSVIIVQVEELGTV